MNYYTKKSMSPLMLTDEWIWMVSYHNSPLPPHISLLLRLLTMFVWMDSGIGSLLAFAVAISSDYNEENKL